MGTLQGLVICPTVRAKQVTVYDMPISSSVTRTAMFKSMFWGYKDACWQRTSAGIISRPLLIRKPGRVHCSFSSSSDGSGNKAEKFNENDGDYVNSSVTEAVEVKSGSDVFTIKLRDGRFLRCVHNSPQEGHLPDYAPHPAIVLKMEDGTDILLPIIVSEMPSVLLMAAMRNVHIPRPTMYQVIKDMIEKMGYEVKLVRITKRVNEAYFAEIYLSKAGGEDCISFELRPSDAVNIAVRCKMEIGRRKEWRVNLFGGGEGIIDFSNFRWLRSLERNLPVPIQVNKNLAHSDGMKIIEPAKLPSLSPAFDGLLCTELDQPSGKPCTETTEFNLLRNMLDAAGEERYQDAAKWRNKLTEFRARRNWA